MGAAYLEPHPSQNITKSWGDHVYVRSLPTIYELVWTKQGVKPTLVGPSLCNRFRNGKSICITRVETAMRHPSADWYQGENYPSAGCVSSTNITREIRTGIATVVVFHRMKSVTYCWRWSKGGGCVEDNGDQITDLSAESHITITNPDLVSLVLCFEHDPEASCRVQPVSNSGLYETTPL